METRFRERIESWHDPPVTRLSSAVVRCAWSPRCATATRTRGPLCRRLGGSAGAAVGGRRRSRLRRWAKDRADQGPCPGLDQQHQLDCGIAVMGRPPEPGSVAGRIGYPQRASAVEGHRPIGAEAYPGVVGRAIGLASISKSDRTDAGPSRRRRSRRAFALGEATSVPAGPPVNLSQASRSRPRGTDTSRAGSTSRPETADHAAAAALTASPPAPRPPARTAPQ